MRNLDLFDLSLTKLAVFCGTLVLVWLFPGLLSVAWYWWLAAAVLLSIRPAMRFFR